MMRSQLSQTNISYFFFFNDTATTEIYTLSLHDALPISGIDRHQALHRDEIDRWIGADDLADFGELAGLHADRRTDIQRILADRKSTRLNSSHSQISYAVFCLKKKKQYDIDHIPTTSYAL